MDREQWHSEHVPPGYPRSCKTELLREVVQDLNDEYVMKKQKGKINAIWEDLISRRIESGNEELQQRAVDKSKRPWLSMDNPIVWILASIILLILVGWILGR